MKTSLMPVGVSDIQCAVENYIEVRRNARIRKSTEHGAKPPDITYDIPVPIQTRGGAHNLSHFYPFESMCVGGSFWVAGDSACTGGAVTKFAQKSGWKFTTRGQSKDGRKNGEVGRKLRGMRVWRVA